MNAEELLKQAKRIQDQARNASSEALPGILAEAAEFIRQTCGSQSAFYRSVGDLLGKDTVWSGEMKTAIESTMSSFGSYVENGLLNPITVQRQAQIDVVSDLLSQSQQLLDDEKIHPAAPTVIIGASLEEFLRNWVESKSYSLGNKKPSIDAYASTLREREDISKQDKKDIDSWAGIRNQAAHGEWEEVADRKRIRLMLEGVNLFMQRYSSK